MRCFNSLRVILAIALTSSVHAQTPPPCPAAHDPADFLQIWNDAVIGPGSRSHACTLSLLTPDARITGVLQGKDGKPELVVETFWERTTHSTITVYENVARVTRTYEVRASSTGPVTSTGIEDFQLIFDGTSWRAFSMLWQDAVPGKPLPPSYLP